MSKWKCEKAGCERDAVWCTHGGEYYCSECYFGSRKASISKKQCAAGIQAASEIIKAMMNESLGRLHTKTGNAKDEVAVEVYQDVIDRLKDF